MVSCNSKKITVETIVNVPVEKVWKYWTKPEHIKRWNNASDDWHTPVSENDLRVGGKFLSRMEAKDGSFGFDFSGTYDEVKLMVLMILANSAMGKFQKMIPYILHIPVTLYMVKKIMTIELIYL